MRRVILSILSSVLLAACGTIVGPLPFVIPEDAVRFAAGVPEQTAFDTIRQCLMDQHVAISGSLSDLTWYRVAGPTFTEPTGQYLGMYFPAMRAIVLADGAPDQATLRRHEIAHFLSGQVSHAAAFWGACGIPVNGYNILFVIP